MKSSVNQLPLSSESEQFVDQSAEWGGMNVSVTEVLLDIDVAPLLKGLPDDRCQSNHWGYVLSGEIQAVIGDQEEIFVEGDLYYLPPGHSVFLKAGTRYIEFSPSEELSKTMEVVARNFEQMT